jgi:hypothetical protein
LGQAHGLLYDSVRVVLSMLTISLMLGGTPIDAPRRISPGFSWRLSVGSFLGSVWAAPSFRDKVEKLKAEQLEDLQTHGSVFDSQYLVYAAPVLGPWLTLIRGGQQAREDMWMLITSGVLQGIGITTLAYRALTPGTAPPPSASSEGVVLDISPYVAGRLGLALTLTGW